MLLIQQREGNLVKKRLRMLVQASMACILALSSVALPAQVHAASETQIVSDISISSLRDVKNLERGEETYVFISTYPEEGVELSAHCDDESIARISLEGNALQIQGISEGTCTVTVTAMMNGKVEQESFSVQDAFAADDEVVISYHVLADLNPPASSDELEGMGYENVVELFEGAGFINVTTALTSASGVGGTVSSVKIGGILGSSDFTTSDSFPFDAGVEITYYEGASTSDEPTQPSTEEVPEEDLSSLLSSSDTDASWFSSAYQGRTITFDGWVANMVNHENYDTRYDVLILAGDNGVSPMTGPNFRLTDVNFYDMNVTNADSLRGGDNITITAIVGEYNSTADWLELDPVSISVR